MAQRIVIDSTAELHAAAVAMDDVHDAVSRAVTTLYHTLAALGDPISVQPNTTATGADVSSVPAATPPWGADSYGKKFGTGENGYVRASVGLLQGGFDLARTLAEFAHGMHRAAGDLHGSEQSSSTAFA
ncbi:hypothetical protein OHB26_21585 [Nocardia sp. NBC_01503]|uniref:hypothetical protein n=1 Tax=Nocardia sp. NBC_01503 TaxID=2975997 RepID=UPI002E7C4CDB|nr:hypothetical protein [Nocardia sp. NBC_01503]WTL29579.1 hypothetical protein OHB26_21585 [Nocardia sp. NBC_01503]